MASLLDPCSITATIDTCCQDAKEPSHKAGGAVAAGCRFSIEAGLLQSHAARVVSHSRRPVGEDADDADLGSQRVQRVVHVAVFLQRATGGIECVVEAASRPAAAKVSVLERPGDDLEALAVGRARTATARSRVLDAELLIQRDAFAQRQQRAATGVQVGAPDRSSPAPIERLNLMGCGPAYLIRRRGSDEIAIP